MEGSLPVNRAGLLSLPVIMRDQFVTVVVNEGRRKHACIILLP